MPYEIPRCQALPLADHQVSFQIDGVEKLRWHYGAQYPRPFFFPLAGPGGSALTRMGHPGDFSHEHHRSIWFAHQSVMGLDFWSEGKPTRIRQKEWLAYLDSAGEAAMAVRIGWVDGHNAELLEQELVAAVRPGSDGETFVELQSTFRPTGNLLELGKTNFGLLAVRVAKNLSVHFGGGTLSSSEGAQGEAAIFGNPARWMDYSGPVPGGPVPGGPVPGGKSEGITYFDHPSNLDHPPRWHVREDGWMGASLCRTRAVELRREQPLVLRYLLHAHSGGYDALRAKEVAAAFGSLPAYSVARAAAPHERYRIQRVAVNP